MPKKSKKLYMQYDPVKLENAVASVKSNTLSLRKAAAKFGIPRSTISDRVVGKVEDGSAPGRPQVDPQYYLLR